MTKTLTVYFEDSDKEVDIEVDIDYAVENNGIGPYEYWGFKGYDKGQDCVNIYSTEWNKTGFSPEEIEIVEEAIEKEKKHWEAEIETDDYVDDPPERDGDYF